MAGRNDCCRYEPSLEDLLDDEMMEPVLRSAGLDTQGFRDMIAETARRLDRRARGARLPLARQCRKFKTYGQSRRVIAEADRAIVQPRGGAHEAEPEAVAGRAAARFETHETVEDDIAVLGRDARPAIRRLRARRAAIDLGDRQADLSAAAVFQRVVEEIGDGLRQEMAVAADHHPGRAVEMQDKALFLGHRLVKLGGGAGELAEVERFGAGAPGARLRLGDAEQRVEGREQPVGLVDRGADRLALRGVASRSSRASSNRARRRASGVFRSCATLSVTSRMPSSALDLVEHAVEIGGELFELVPLP